MNSGAMLHCYRWVSSMRSSILLLLKTCGAASNINEQWSHAPLLPLGQQHEKQHFAASQNLRCSLKYQWALPAK